MTKHFFDIAFTPNVRKAQAENASAEAYGRLMTEEPGQADLLSLAEAQFIAARDSFYMASISETGWPYVQHRGGAKGFVKVISSKRIGMADFRGNRQYVSVGNMSGNNRVSLIFMDYPNQRRLKILAHSRIVSLEEEPDLAQILVDDDYKAKVERLVVFDIEAFDWNCPQHITPRYTPDEMP